MFIEHIEILAIRRLVIPVALLFSLHMMVYLFSDSEKFLGFRIFPASFSELKGLVLRVSQTAFVGAALLAYSETAETVMWVGLGGMIVASVAWWQSNPGLARFSWVLLALAALYVLTVPAIVS
jgi:hypothetical protein